MGRLEGKVAAITGASSGIGRGIAEKFASEGATVVLGARRQGLCEDLAKKIESRGGKAYALPLDVKEESSVARFIATTISRYQRLDVFVNNAGVGIWKPVVETTTAEFDSVIRTNLYGTFFGCREAFRQMRLLANGGTIVNISSVAGTDAWEGTGTYSASKFAIHGLSRALADEGKEWGIHVSCICPGMVDTPMVDDDDAGGKGQRRDLIQVGDVAEAALYLATLGKNVIVNEVILNRRTLE